MDEKTLKLLTTLVERDAEERKPLDVTHKDLTLWFRRELAEFGRNQARDLREVLQAVSVDIKESVTRSVQEYLFAAANRAIDVNLPFEELEFPKEPQMPVVAQELLDKETPELE